MGKEGLINEIEVMRSISHNNLMKLYGVYESKNSIYMVVELLGAQLHKKVNELHHFSLEETRRIMKDILNGL
jgi:calcium-dependent protein kinase